MELPPPVTASQAAMNRWDIPMVYVWSYSYTDIFVYNYHIYIYTHNIYINMHISVWFLLDLLGITMLVGALEHFFMFPYIGDNHPT